jgi:hypothetical protein
MRSSSGGLCKAVVMWLLAGILGTGLLVFALVLLLHDTFRERDVTAVVNTTEDQRVREVLSLAQATQIDGHPWLLVALESDQKYDQAYLSKSAVAGHSGAHQTGRNRKQASPRAQFERGEAELRLIVVREGSSWKVRGFNVDSPALLKLRNDVQGD